MENQITRVYTTLVATIIFTNCYLCFFRTQQGKPSQLLELYYLFYNTHIIYDEIHSIAKPQQLE